jgi:hypothetical protein
MPDAGAAPLELRRELVGDVGEQDREFVFRRDHCGLCGMRDDPAMAGRPRRNGRVINV